MAGHRHRHSRIDGHGVPRQLCGPVAQGRTAGDSLRATARQLAYRMVDSQNGRLRFHVDRSYCHNYYAYLSHVFLRRSVLYTTELAGKDIDTHTAEPPPPHLLSLSAVQFAP